MAFGDHRVVGKCAINRGVQVGRARPLHGRLSHVLLGDHTHNSVVVRPSVLQIGQRGGLIRQRQRQTALSLHQFRLGANTVFNAAANLVDQRFMGRPRACSDFKLLLSAPQVGVGLCSRQHHLLFDVSQ